MSESKLATHRATHRVRVRYCETDRMGVAHHGSYIDWIEEARTEWLRSAGVSYRELEESGVFLPIVDVRVQYRTSVTYDDAVLIETWLEGTRRVSVKIGYRLTREEDGVLVAEAMTELACIDGDGKVRRLPPELV